MKRASPRLSRNFLFRWILGLGVLLTVLGADFCVRNLYLVLRASPHGRIYHPVFDHGLRPNCAWMDKYGPLKTPYFSNSLGFRDFEIRHVPLRTDHRRILLIGDSYCEGVGVPWEKTVAGILSEKLAPQNVEVLNAGVMSYTPIIEKIKLRHFNQ